MCIFDDDVQEFQKLFIKATAAIPDKYFLLPVYTNEENEPTSIYRERVYCYELYHHMRTLWPYYNLKSYSICAEIDKRKHSVIELNPKPDFLVHNAGDMSKNLVIIEVKPLKDRNYIKDDLIKLTKFQNDNYKYKSGFYLFYGNNEEKLNNIKNNARKHELKNENINLFKIKLFYHQKPEKPAELKQW